MIVSAATLQNIRQRVISAGRAVIRPDLAFLKDGEFRAGLRHGLSIAGGGIVGLCIWAAFQGPAPSPYRDYVVRVPMHQEEPHKPAKIEDKPQDDEPEAVTYTDHRPDSAPHKATVPTPGLIEAKAPYGDLPIVRASDKLRPFDAYRQPFPADQLSKPLIAVVMLDYGLSAEASGSILGVMPPEVNVAIAPAAQGTKDWSQKAFDHGHEIWLELAAEPATYPAADPGANALLTSAPVERNQAALYRQLGAAVGYAGLIGREPSPYYSSGADADFMAGLVYDRGLGLVLNAPDAAPILKNEAMRTKSPYYAGTMIALDATLQRDAMLTAFAQVEATARDKGFAIALFRPSGLARKEVLDWLSTLKTKNLTLAPLSVIAERGIGLAP